MKCLSTTLAFAVPVVCLFLASCFSKPAKPKPEIREITISDHSAGLNFSVHWSDDRLHIIYPSLNALSLNLVTADLSEDPLSPAVQSTTYLDRISYSPDIDDSFGRHLFLSSDPLSHILYVDLESEDNSVLKWLSKSDDEDTWWIDAFPGFAQPYIAIPRDGGTLEVVLSAGDTLSLYRLSRDAQPTRLAANVLDSRAFRPRGDISVIRQADYWGFTAYDSVTGRLYLVRPSGHAISLEPIYAAGEVHYSTIAGDRLLVLVFEPAKSTITLLDRPVAGNDTTEAEPFAASAVTLCEGTSSVYLFHHAGNRLFLFNERVTEHSDHAGYQLSLLFRKFGESVYEKRALLEGEAAIAGFHALKAGDFLYVLYLRGDSLNLLSLPLADL